MNLKDKLQSTISFVNGKIAECEAFHLECQTQHLEIEKLDWDIEPQANQRLALSIKNSITALEEKAKWLLVKEFFQLQLDAYNSDQQPMFH